MSSAEFQDMSPNYSKNAIMTGPISSDFFCLICEQYFTNAIKCYEHMHERKHKKNMNIIESVEKLEEDTIKKIKDKYFCELCNKLMPAFARVSVHIEEPTHIENKYYNLLKRIDNVVVAFDKLVISDTAWHGQCNNTCCLCNIDYVDKEKHKQLPSHLINLIESKVKFDKNKNIYRMIDNSMHCMTCNQLQAYDTRHFESQIHKLMYQIACDNYKAIQINQSHNLKPVLGTSDKKSSVYIRYNENKCVLCNWTINISNIEEHVNGVHHKSLLNKHKQSKVNEDDTQSNKTNINQSISVKMQNKSVLDSLNKFQSNNININFERQTAVCKKCSIILEFEHDVIDKHILEHNGQLKIEKMPIQCEDSINHEKKTSPQTNITSPVIQKCSEDLQKPSEGNNSKTNGIADKPKNDSTPCATHMDDLTPSSPKVKKTKDVLEMISIKDFIESIIGVKNLVYKDVVINNKICINNFSFCLITFLTDKENMKCFVCDENILYGAFEAHIYTRKHEKGMKEAMVLIKSDTEFIRKINDGFFHCGFCNVYLSSWNELEKHLKTSFHIESKNVSYWRLKQYQPMISKKSMTMKTMVDTVHAYMFAVKFL